MVAPFVLSIKENTTNAVDLQQRETRRAAHRAAPHGSTSGCIVLKKAGTVKISCICIV